MTRVSVWLACRSCWIHIRAVLYQSPDTLRRTMPMGEISYMKLVFRYLKPFAVIIILCVLLLFGQAMCELSLPNLMSNIVNNGIQNSGVSEPAPNAISENGMALIARFVPEGDKAEFTSAYRLISPGSDEANSLAADYPAADSQSIYMLTADDAAAKERISEIYGRAALSFLRLMQGLAEQSGADMGYDQEAGIADVDMAQLYAMLPMLDSIPAASIEQAMTASAAQDSMLHDQIGVTFTRLFYSELGVNLTDLQHSYIVNTGLMMLLVSLLSVAAAVSVGFFASRVSSRVAQKLRRDVFAKVEGFSSAAPPPPL